jgi:type IX secretion system PorP/SprF family membrane protein
MKLPVKNYTLTFTSRITARVSSSCLLLIASLGLAKLSAQQMGLANQYDRISSVLNPAYNGINRAVQVDAITKSQWANFPGSPKMNVVGAQIPLNRDFAAGINLQTLSVGKFQNAKPLSLFAVGADLAYHKQLAKNLNVSTGLRVGMFSYNAQLSLLNANDPNDGSLVDNNYIIKTPLIGGGIMLYGKQYFVSASMPQYAIMANEQINQYNINYASAPMMIFSTGFLQKLSSDWEAKITVQGRHFSGLPFHVDANAYFYYKNQIMFGYGRRNNTADVYQLQIRFNEFVWINYGYERGYIYDSQTPFSSHEFGVSYKFYQPSKQMFIEPRNY